MKKKASPAKLQAAKLKIKRALKLHDKKAAEAAKAATDLAAIARQHDGADAAWAAEKAEEAAKAHAEAPVAVKKEKWWKFWA